MTQHSECRDREWFVGNVHKDDGMGDHMKSLSTARLGTKAYDVTGKRLHDYRPVFIGASDYLAYDRIMMNRYRAASRGQAVGS